MRASRSVRLLFAVLLLGIMSSSNGLLSQSAPQHSAKSQGIRDHSKRRVKTRHFVFGYGSLICPESRSVTNPGLADREPLPVVVQDVERVWSARTSSGYTAMGVRFAKDTECTGVLIEVDSNQLADLDKREANYDRLPIQLDNIDQVPFLEEEEFYDSDHPVFEAKESSLSATSDEASEQVGVTEDGELVKVWIYMQKDPIPADPSHPIPQSYVDIIIRGCLTISEDFAKSFIETTAGWDHEEDHWVDDRNVPLYRRADPEFSSEHGDKIDAIFEEHKPEALEERVEYDPVDHLEALADALEEDMAHPRAIKHVAKRVREAVNLENAQDS